MKKGFLLNKFFYDVEKKVIKNEKDKIDGKYCKDDFEIYMHIGSGNFSDVFMVKLKSDPSKVYSLKIFEKEKLSRMNKINDILIEKYAMTKLNIPGHANVIKLIDTFKDKQNFYLLYEYVDFELWEFLKTRCIGADEYITFNLILQMVYALEYIHSKNIIHRDIKCENFVINKNGTIKLIDLGTSKDLDNIPVKTVNEPTIKDTKSSNFTLKKKNKDIKESLYNKSSTKGDNSFKMENFNNNILDDNNEKNDNKLNDVKSKNCVFKEFKNNGNNVLNKNIFPKNSNSHLNILKDDKYPIEIDIYNYKRKKKFVNYVGTPNFMPPEALLNKCSGKARDLWSLGCTIYQLVTCTASFDGSTEWFIYNKIKNKEIKYPPIMSFELIDLIEKLINLNPEERLGFKGGCREILEHPYFQKYNYKILNFNLPEVSDAEKIYTNIMNKYHEYVIEKRKLRQMENNVCEESNKKIQQLKNDLLNIIKCDTPIHDEENESTILKRKIVKTVHFLVQEFHEQEKKEIKEAEKWLKLYSNK